MICKKCKKELPDGTKVCDVCGAKQKGFPVVLLCIAGVAVLLAVIIAANFAVVKNAALRLFLSSDNYAKYVLKNNLDHSADFAEWYGICKKPDRRVTTSVSVELSEDAVAELQEYADDNGYDGLPMAAFADLSGSWTIEGRDGLTAVSGEISVGEEQLASVECFYDAEEHIFYGRIPQMNEQFFAIELEEYMDRAELQQVDEITEALAEVQSALPAPEQVKGIMKRYFILAVTELYGFEEKNTNLTCNGIRQNCVELTITLDDELMSDLAVAVLKEMAKDDEIKDILEDVADLDAIDDLDVDPEELYEDAIDDALEAAEDFTTDDEMEITLYVSNKGKIIGTEIICKEGKDEVYAFFAAATQRGKAYGFEASFRAEEEETFHVRGEGTRDKNGITAEYEVKTNEGKFKFQTENLDLSDWAKGVIRGNITLEMKSLSEMLDVDETFRYYTFRLETDIRPEMSSIKASLLEKEETCLALVITQEITDADKIDVPADKDADPLVTVGDFLDYVEDCEFDYVLDGAKTLGVPKSVRNELRDSIEGVEYNIEIIRSLGEDDADLADFGAADSVRILSYMPLLPTLAGNGFSPITAGFLAPQLIKYNEKVREAASYYPDYDY